MEYLLGIILLIVGLLVLLYFHQRKKRSSKTEEWTRLSEEARLEEEAEHASQETKLEEELAKPKENRREAEEEQHGKDVEYLAAKAKRKEEAARMVKEAFQRVEETKRKETIAQLLLRLQEQSKEQLPIEGQSPDEIGKDVNTAEAEPRNIPESQEENNKGPTLQNEDENQENELSPTQKQNIEAFKTKRTHVWHFSHLFNIVEILQSKRMLSRERAIAEGVLKMDAAGNLVGRIHKAHPYVRFYFTTGTPTQFYNEGLGKNPKDCYYEKAEHMGFPKCPLPVFLRIDLDELLTKVPQKCFYSDGNLQQDRRQIYSVIDDPNNLNTLGFDKRVVDWEQYSDAVQQEFLILGELDLASINSLKIFCYNESHKQLLQHLCPTFSTRMEVCSRGIFDRKNPGIALPENGVNRISSNFEGEHHYEIRGTNLDSLTITPQETIFFRSETLIRIRASEFKWIGTLPHFEIYFIDERPKARIKESMIYKTCSSTVHHLNILW